MHYSSLYTKCNFVKICKIFKAFDRFEVCQPIDFRKEGKTDWLVVSVNLPTRQLMVEREVMVLNVTLNVVTCCYYCDRKPTLVTPDATF